MENFVTETISRIEGCPSMWALEVFQQQFPIEFSFFDHCVLSLLQRFVQPFPVKNFAGSKTMLLRIYFARLGFSHSLALREQKPRADFFFPNWPWEILYKRLLFEDCSLLFLHGKVQDHWNTSGIFVFWWGNRSSRL